MTLATDPVVSPQTLAEERVNIVTHGIGAALAVVALLTTTFLLLDSGVTRLVSTVIFCSALVLTYVVSTGFHLAARHPSRPRWRLLDHASIYVLIAGTYTPIMLVVVGGTWGWSITLAAWLMAVAGVGMKVVLVGRYDRFEKLDSGLYLLMGWMCIIAILPIWQAMSGWGFTFLLVGGLSYSVGVIFFLWDKLPQNHAIWHGFVLAGSAFHFAAVWVDVVRA